MDTKKKIDQENEKINASTISGMQDTVQRYGSAVKEHYVAYSGTDYENQIELTRSLKSISKSKINPKTKYQNIRQQSGFSAEVKETARTNAENIIKGKATRLKRTDDMGSVNDPFYDHKEVDRHGNTIPGSGTQMKFVGSDPDECLDKLMGSKYQKYREANVPFEVPNDYYDEIKKEIDERISKLQNQKEHALKSGNIERAQKHQQKINEYKQVKNNLRQSHVTNKEAEEARLNPRLSTVKDIHDIAHRAGMEGAKTGAVVGGMISSITNIVQVFQQKKSAREAVADIACTTGKSAVSGYVMTYSSTALKGVMQNSSKEFIRTLSKTGMPGAIVATAISSIGTIQQFLSGNIDGVECMKQIGKSGASITSSMAYGAVGQVLIPIPVVGAMVGGMIGYALASSCYGGLLKDLQEAKQSAERRKAIEAECQQAIQAIQQYRREIQQITESYFMEYQNVFDSAFTSIKHSMQIGDVDGFIKGMNTITHQMGGTTQFETKEEFDQCMMSDEPFIL